MPYSPQTSFLPPETLRSIQEQGLRDLLRYLAANSPFYQELFSKNNLDVSKITTLADLIRIPATSKDDLHRRSGDFVCVGREKIVEYTSTSGTLGSPVTIVLTEADLDRLAYNEYASFLCTDGSSADVYQLMLTLDRQFMAGMAYYSGLRRLGAGIVRVGPGVPQVQWDTIRRLKPTVLVAVPSFLVNLLRYALEHRIDPNETSVKKAICIGEPIRNIDASLNGLGRKITEAWDIRLYSTYASTEMQTAFTECDEGRGGHLQPELVIVELLDEHEQPVPPGEPGEVTITTIGVEGMPLLRYKTGDVCRLDDQPCACGRHTLRLLPIEGRKQQMLKFKGTTLYPPALFELLNGLDEVREYVVEAYSNDLGLDEVRLYLLPTQLSDEADRKIRAYLQANLRVSPPITYVSADQIQRMQFPEGGRKAVKFLDKRK